MATSGTVGQTVFNTGKVIDNAYRGCRLPPSAVSGEMIQVAKDQLYLILSSLANTGAPLWCITKDIIPLYFAEFTVPCPVGTVDVLNANLRTLQRLTGTYTSTSGTVANAFDGDVTTLCTEIAVAGQITVQLDSQTFVTNVGFLPGATGYWDVSLQWSDDGVTWTTFYTNAALAVVNSEWQWFDFEGLRAHVYWRLQAGAATTLVVRELVWGNMPQEIPLARINKDDYFNLPNKAFTGRPTEYWLDQQRSVANLMVWPAPDDASQFRQVTVLVHRHIMDVGTMTQELEVPQRWYDAIVWQLAKKLSMITPEVKPDFIPSIRQEAMDTLKLAWADQRDNSPIQIMPNLRPYTA